MYLPIQSSSDIIFLCGSGISVPYPSCAFTVDHFLRKLGEYISSVCSYPREKVDQCLFGSKEFPRLRFELVAYCLKEVDPECSFLESLKIRRVGSEFEPASNNYHKYLAEMISEGAVVVTTNFDCFIELALLQIDSTRLAQFLSRLDKPHGTAQKYISGEFQDVEPDGIATTIFEVARGSNISGFPKRLQAFVHRLESRKLFVIGYSASDSYDIVPALHVSCPASCTWFSYSQEPPHEATREVLSSEIRNLLDVWGAQGISTKIVQGDLQWNRSAEVVTCSVQDRLHLRPYSREEMQYVVGRLALNQGDYQLAREAFSQWTSMPPGQLRDWSLKFFARPSVPIIVRHLLPFNLM